MKRTFGHRLVLLATVAAFVALIPCAPRAQGEDETARTVTLHGTVEVGEVDDAGKLVSVSIWDEREGAVLILPTGKGRELLKEVGAVVEASGTLRPRTKDLEYDYEMTLTSYEVIEPAGEEEPDED